MIDRPFSELVAALAARTPAPGGGAAGGMAAAMGNALLLMAIRFSRGKKANAAREAELARAEARLTELAPAFLALAQRDADGFAPAAAAYAMPQGTEAEKAARRAAIDRGLLGAMAVPHETVALCRDALAAAVEVASCAGKSIVSDLAAGAELLHAAAEIAARNVRINRALLADPEPASATVAAVAALGEEVARHCAALRAAAERAIAG
ncbi:MAG TPA: cyclodeaminase/cyclohydrolase family protein [Planctomycetota bacterium]|nr:cyclodeaminase/cyclohydrolase family protein [Planctomycetota bacterium]